MNKVFAGAGKLWKETKSAIKDGADFISSEVKDHMDVHDQNFIELEKDLKNVKIVAKKNVETVKVLTTAILQSSAYSLKIANEFLQTFAGDPANQTQATSILAATQKSDSKLKELCQKHMPEYMQIPFDNILKNVEGINKERKKVRSYLLEKEKLEKRLTDQLSKGERTAVEKTRIELSAADMEYSRAYAELKPKVDQVKAALYDASKKALHATVFYFGQFVKVVDQLQTAYNENSPAHVSLSDPMSIFQPPQINQNPQIVAYPQVQPVQGYGYVSYPQVQPVEEDFNPYAEIPVPEPQNQRIATPA